MTKYRRSRFARSLNEAFGHPGPAITAYTDPERQIVRPVVIFIVLALVALAAVGAFG